MIWFLLHFYLRQTCVKITWWLNINHSLEKKSIKLSIDQYLTLNTENGFPSFYIIDFKFP